MSANQPEKTIDDLLAKHDGYALEEYKGSDGHDYSQNANAIELKAALSAMVKTVLKEARPLYYASPDKSEYQRGFNDCIAQYESGLRQRAAKMGFRL